MYLDVAGVPRDGRVPERVAGRSEPCAGDYAG